MSIFDHIEFMLHKTLPFQIEENGLAFVYCIGALKVLSANTDNTIGDILVQYGVLQVTMLLNESFQQGIVKVIFP